MKKNYGSPITGIVDLKTADTLYAKAAAENFRPPVFWARGWTWTEEASSRSVYFPVYVSIKRGTLGRALAGGLVIEATVSIPADKKTCVYHPRTITRRVPAGWTEETVKRAIKGVLARARRESQRCWTIWSIARFWEPLQHVEGFCEWVEMIEKRHGLDSVYDTMTEYELYCWMDLIEQRWGKHYLGADAA